MVGWHHRLNGHELRDSDGQGSLVCCSPWGCKESDTTERVSNNKGASRMTFLQELREQVGIKALNYTMFSKTRDQI